MEPGYIVESARPALTRRSPSLDMPQIHEPHSGQTNRVLVRPLSAVRWSPRGSIPISRKAVSATTTPSENALPVKRWQSTQWHV